MIGRHVVVIAQVQEPLPPLKELDSMKTLAPEVLMGVSPKPPDDTNDYHITENWLVFEREAGPTTARLGAKKV